MDLLYHDMYHNLKQFRIHDCSNSWCMVTFLNWQKSFNTRRSNSLASVFTFWCAASIFRCLVWIYYGEGGNNKNQLSSLCMFLQAKPLGDCFSKGVGGGCGGVFFPDFSRVIGPTFVCSRIVDCLRDAYWLWDDKSEINGEWEEKEWCCVLFYCTAVTLQRSLTLEIPRTLIFYATPDC